MSANATEAADSRELEDLFDSIALAPHAPEAAPAETPVAAVAPAPAPTQPPPVKPPQLHAVPQAPAEPQAGAVEIAQNVHSERECPANKVINSVGVLTRQLHDTLAELGYDRHLQAVTADALPDARQRLAYVVTLTEQAASRSLNAVDIATPVQEKLAADAASLAASWDTICSGKSSVEEFRKVAAATRDYLHAVPGHTQTTRDQLREIVMAQEFQDLTGQVLKRITDLANTLETQLLTLLVENSQIPVKHPEALGKLSGPQIGAAAADSVANQAQVDELLESLGF